MMLQYADAVISCAHEAHGGVMHGHSYRVRAFWDTIIDVTARKSALLHACAVLDHTTLPVYLTRAEQIAENIGDSLDCCSVEVSRPLEGLGARWLR